MNRNEKIQMVITTLLCLLPALLAICIYPDLPDQIPIHFDSQWEADGYASKFIGGIMFPVGLAALNLFLYYIMANDPRRANVAGPMKMISGWLIPVLSIITIPSILFMSMGYSINVGRIIPVIISFIFIIYGNYLPKCRTNQTIGIRIPWTLKDDVVWNKTNHMAGILYVTGGIVLLFISWTLSKITYLYIGVIILLAIIPILYSYLLYRKRNKK